MTEAKLFRCAECGGPVQLMAKPGRERVVARGQTLPIPADFEIPTCAKCGETYFDPEISERLDAILRPQLLEMQKRHYRELVGFLKHHYNVTVRDIENACAVTPTYFSLVMNGKRRASATLTRLLEAFVRCGDEFVRNLKGEPWTPVEALDIEVCVDVEEGFAPNDLGAWDDQRPSLRPEIADAVELAT